MRERPDAGLVIFQARDNTHAMTLSGNATAGVAGTIYAANAAVGLSGNATLGGALVASTPSLSGNVVENTLDAGGALVYTPAQIRSAYATCSSRYRLSATEPMAAWPLRAAPTVICRHRPRHSTAWTEA
jgi:hypothetical protein